MKKTTELFVRFMESKPHDKMAVYFLAMVIIWLLLSSPFMIYFRTVMCSVDGSLRDPTYDEVIAFLRVDQTDKNTYRNDTYTCTSFTRDVMFHAHDIGLRSYFVVIQFEGMYSTHAIVGFNTTDFGMQYFEPQSDLNMDYCEINYTILDNIKE